VNVNLAFFVFFHYFRPENTRKIDIELMNLLDFSTITRDILKLIQAQKSFKMGYFEIITKLT
jgi:hypothetical protein